MTGSRLSANPLLDMPLLERLAGLEPATALAELAQLNLATSDTVKQLADVALAQAEAKPEMVNRWLAIALALNQMLDNNPALQAQLNYTQARLYVQEGNLALAEITLRTAQAIWQANGDQVALMRSQLGLTQIFAMQGRYTDAEEVARQAIAQLQQAAETDSSLIEHLAAAHHNLATLFVYQERHAAALEEYAQARQILEDRLATFSDQPLIADSIRLELAHLHLNQASALMFLDQTYEAETALHTAINLFAQANDHLNLGRARTNLGSLYLRTGRYADALTLFDSAARDIIGDVTASADVKQEQLRNADALLLDQATAYLALNLLPEATMALERCEVLFRAADMPYELSQTLLTLGLLRLHTGAVSSAQTVLLEAERLFTKLQNSFGINRTGVALAALAYQRDEYLSAATRLDSLLSQTSTSPEPTASDPAVAIRWDIGTLAEAYLLRLRLHVERNELAAARQMAAVTGQAIGAISSDSVTASGPQPLLPHLYFRLQHALSTIEAAAGNRERAQHHLRTAITVLENQRASLPVEEIRTAFLDDKTAVYNNLILTLLDEQGETSLSEAFDMVERARSRALLDRLQATLPDNRAIVANDAAATRHAQIQQQLHWLYNQLFSEAGDHRADMDIGQEIRAREIVLQQLEWQATPQNTLQLVDAEPAGLADLQQALSGDQQALVYYMAGTEVLVFLVSRQHMQIFRHLCTTDELKLAQSEWHFQLERAEMGADYLSRHPARFERAWRNALLQLYRLLLMPLSRVLTAPRLLVIPYGSLHLLPFHALWDGQQFMLEQFEFVYAPSASLAVRTQTQQITRPGWHSWAGLAITDPAIPAARQEVETAARHFPQAWLYLDEAANRANLHVAARQADILHLATHGLFRPDNAFFSGLKLADGWVDVREIYRLVLRARMVVLSACESGAGQIRGGDEVIGLARGFLGAGVHSLLVSLWNVHDASSALFMDRFYRALTADPATSTPSAALRIAQLAAIAQQQHPYYWASFFIIGA